MARRRTTRRAVEQTPGRRECGTMEVYHRQLEMHPEFRQRLVQIEQFTARSMLFGMMARATVTTVPVLVHIVYRAEEENIPDAQVKTQIDVLNKDYRARNTDKNIVPGAWASLIADAMIEFRLEDISRTKTTQTSFGTDNSVKNKDTGGIAPKAPDKYLNIWVCRLTGGLLGYAQFPGGPQETDGVVIRYTAFGTTGQAAQPFHLGRTTTHEVGHWLNLHHIWGDTNDCSGTDYVADTPNAQFPNYGKPVFPHLSCNNGPNGDMFMNYMDYVDDAAMAMFTTGQVARMAAALAGPRSGVG